MILQPPELGVLPRSKRPQVDLSKVPEGQPCFIDWINIHQKHNGLNEFCGGYVMETDDQDNEKWRTAKHFRAEGSYSTSVGFRSFAGQVELRGNVGRWCRRDNVFNLDFETTIQRANEILDCFSLPAFCDDGDYYEDNDGNICSNGAHVTRLDVTRNYLTGSPENAAAFMGWLDGQSLPYIRRGRSIGGTTVQWGSNTGRFKLICYDKAREMLDHAPNELERQIIKASKIYQYCYENGLVRVEFKIGRQELQDKGLRFLGDITMGKLIYLFNEKTAFLHGAAVPETLHLVDLPRSVQMTYAAYMSGNDVTKILKPMTLWRHAKALSAFGVDIRSAPTAQRLNTKVRELEIVAASVPDWYWREAA